MFLQVDFVNRSFRVQWTQSGFIIIIIILILLLLLILLL
jgi:hypothetical protein